MIPVIFEMIHSGPMTIKRIKISRRTTRVGGPYASTAALAAVAAAAASLVPSSLTIVNELRRRLLQLPTRPQFQVQAAA